MVLCLMITGVVSTLKLNLSQHPDMNAFNGEGSTDAKKKRRHHFHLPENRVLENSLIIAGGSSLIGLLAFWKHCQMTPEKGLYRSINAQSIPVLSNLRLPKSGMSLVDITSVGMTSINSIARIFFALLTHQHTFETIGLEALTRLSTISLIKAVKGNKNKEGEESLLSINRWFLNYMMKPKNLTRKIDTPVKEAPWVQFNFNWRNTVGLAIQEMCGLNTPFEVMFPHIKTPPDKAGTLVDAEIQAFRKRLTLENTELDIFNAMTKGVTIQKAYNKAKQGFQNALASPKEVISIRKAYETFADAQYQYNHHFHNLRYTQSNEGVKDHWVGRESREAFEKAVEALTGQKPDATSLNEQTQHLWKALDAKNEKQNKLSIIPRHSDEVDWEKQLTVLGQREAQKSLQVLRDDLKAGILYPLLKEQMEKVLILQDGKTGIAKDTPRRLMDIFLPYLKEATKYFRYDAKDLQLIKALKEKNPSIPTPVNLYDLSEEGMLQLFNGFMEDLDALNTPISPIRPREFAMEEGFGISTKKPLTDAEKLKLFRAKAHERLSKYLDFKEEQNLTLNQFSFEANNAYNELIESCVKSYMEAQAKSSKELKFDYYLAQAFGEARTLNTKKTSKHEGDSPQLFTGKVFDPLDAAFKLNERINDIDQYKRNNAAKSVIQVAFQTAVTAFVLSNVLFFIVYNSFSRLDPDYKGHGKIPLNDWLNAVKGFMGEKEDPTEKEKAPVEAKVNVSINLNKTLLNQNQSVHHERKHKGIQDSKVGGMNP